MTKKIEEFCKQIFKQSVAYQNEKTILKVDAFCDKKKEEIFKKLNNGLSKYTLKLTKYNRDFLEGKKNDLPIMFEFETCHVYGMEKYFTHEETLNIFNEVIVDFDNSFNKFFKFKDIIYKFRKDEAYYTVLTCETTLNHLNSLFDNGQSLFENNELQNSYKPAKRIRNKIL